jgi:hypothetical protein
MLVSFKGAESADWSGEIWAAEGEGRDGNGEGGPGLGCFRCADSGLPSSSIFCSRNRASFACHAASESSLGPETNYAHKDGEKEVGAQEISRCNLI